MTVDTKANIDFKQVASELPCGLVLLDQAGTIVWLNDTATTWCDAKQGDLWRHTVAHMLAPNPEDGDEILLKSGQKIKVETSPMAHGQGIVLVDVTHSRQLQEKLNQEKRLQVLGNMCANLAHQIRNPLCAALLQVQSLKNKYPKESKLEKVLHNLNSIEQEINAILLFSRSDKALVEPLSLEKIVLDAIAVSNIESKEIAIDLQNHILNDTVIGNLQALTGALTNVISNAIEASSDKDCVSITLKEQGGELLIEVTDKGHGIEPALLSQVFEPFFTTKAKGTGLGMAITQQIIRNHQGTITLSSQLGQGTVVAISIPKGNV